MPRAMIPSTLTPVLRIAAAVWLLTGVAAAPAGASAPVCGYEVVHVYPHDPGAYTQGLIVEGSVFYEGTGLYGGSSLRKVDVATGLVLKQHDLPSEYFGEGITALRDTIYQLTWTNHVGFTYVEQDTFELLQTFDYAWAGWGLTHDGTHLIASDGTSLIRFLDPGTRQLVSQVQVRDGQTPVPRLNELEYIQGRIYANVYLTDSIAVIQPGSGQVEAWLDLGGLRDSVSYYPQAGVLNGIAFDPVGSRLFVTGKRWPKLFEIDVPTLHASGVAGDPAPLREEPVALRSFPNPCRGRTELAFALTAEAPVTVGIYDARGRLVRTLLDGWQGAGEHALDLDVSRFPPGAYFVRLVSGETVVERKLLVVR